MNNQPDEHTSWTDPETALLNEHGYYPCSPYAWRSGYPDLRKEFNGYNSYYKVGVESEARDVDGDWGWCRTWHSFDSLQEAFGLIFPHKK